MVANVPTRVKPSGTITITAGQTVVFSGTDNKQTRIAFVVTNLDASNVLNIQTSPQGRDWGTVFARGYFAVSFSGDFQITNLSAGSIQCQVAELYPDTGNLHDPYPVLGVPKLANAAPPGTPSAPGGNTGGGTTGGSGSGTGTGGNFIQAGGGTHLR